MQQNRVCEILGIEKPILQGPMSWVSTAPLAAAVSEAGGFGVLGTAMASPEIIQTQMQLLKKITNKPFGFNMAFHAQFLNDDYFAAILKIINKEKPTAVHLDTMRNNSRSFDYAFAKKYFDQWHEAGIKIITKVFTMRDATLAEKAGSDLIIVKGWEGGGHTTEQTTMVLVPQAVDCLHVPVIASGGIADGRGMAAAFMLGAEAVEMGTAFIVAEETAVHVNAKKAVIEATDMPTVEIGRSADEPCRQLRNALSDQVAVIERAHPATVAADMIKPMVNRSGRVAMQEGDIARGAVMAGQSAVLVKEIRPVQRIIDEALLQCKSLLQKGRGLAISIESLQ